jgi:hypothetical protein
MQIKFATENADEFDNKPASALALFARSRSSPWLGIAGI